MYPSRIENQHSPNKPSLLERARLLLIMLNPLSCGYGYYSFYGKGRNEARFRFEFHDHKFQHSRPPSEDKVVLDAAVGPLMVSKSNVEVMVDYGEGDTQHDNTLHRHLSDSECNLPPDPHRFE